MTLDDSKGRPHNSETDYTIILEAARKEPLRIGPIAFALEAAGIHWPFLQDNYGNATAEQSLMDKEIGRAWKELGQTT